MNQPMNQYKRRPKDSESIFSATCWRCVNSVKRAFPRILGTHNKLFGFLYNIADLSRASDDDLQTQCEALESALTANYCEGTEGQQRLEEKDLDARDLQRELRSLIR